MAIVLYKVHVEELSYPYRRELVDMFSMTQYDDVMKFVEAFNNGRSHIWSFKLEAKVDSTIEIEHIKNITV